MRSFRLTTLLRWLWCLLLTAATSAGAQGFAQGACDTVNDTVKQATALLSPASTRDDLNDALQRLKYVTNECPDHGDAWFYRACVERKLGRPATEVDFSMGRARRNRSQALIRGIDPLASSANPAGANQPASGDNAGDFAPQIEITSPPVVRGQATRVKSCQVTIKGQAIDRSAIREVTINNTRAEVDQRGNFFADLTLKPGNNAVTVTVTNTGGKTASKDFTLVCENQPSSTMASGATSSKAGAYYALIIAVQLYQHPSVTALDYPVSDARKVKQTLTQHYTFESGNVTLLENPDREKIISELDQLADKLKPEDHLLVFYAGHGHWDEQRQQGYWLPSDAQRATRSKWISNSDLRDAVKGIIAGHTLVISDACFSGGLLLTREAFAKTPVVEEMLKLKSRTAMTSGALTTVPDRSVFVKYLVEYLEKNTDPYLFASDLFSHIRIPVVNNSPKQSDGNRPTPRYGTIAESDDRGGDFVFVRRR